MVVRIGMDDPLASNPDKTGNTDTACLDWTGRALRREQLVEHHAGRPGVVVLVVQHRGRAGPREHNLGRHGDGRTWIGSQPSQLKVPAPAPN